MPKNVNVKQMAIVVGLVSWLFSFSSSSFAQPIKITVQSGNTTASEANNMVKTDSYGNTYMDIPNKKAAPAKKSSAKKRKYSAKYNADDQDAVDRSQANQDPTDSPANYYVSTSSNEREIDEQKNVGEDGFPINTPSEPRTSKKVVIIIKPYVAVTAGVASAKIGKTQTLQVRNDYKKEYLQSSGTDNKFVGGLSAGVLIPIGKRFSTQVGIGYYQNQKFTSEGKIYEFANPEYYGNDYDYDVSGSRIMLETKLFYQINKTISPYLNLGIGYARNKASNYKITTRNPNNIVPMEPFADKTTNSIAYQIGAGIDFVLSTHWKLGGEYQYQDWGSADLGKYPNQSTNDTPSTDNIHVNNILLNLTYLFDKMEI